MYIQIHIHEFQALIISQILFSELKYLSAILSQIKKFIIC